uniref:Uncharacterized protein n=1 Tax=Arundo donax TaxID=35708 RepID=A0A0A9BL69_ARUDO
MASNRPLLLIFGIFKTFGSSNRTMLLSSYYLRYLCVAMLGIFRSICTSLSIFRSMCLKIYICVAMLRR